MWFSCFDLLVFLFSLPPHSFALNIFFCASRLGQRKLARKQQASTISFIEEGKKKKTEAYSFTVSLLPMSLEVATTAIVDKAIHSHSQFGTLR